MIRRKLATLLDPGKGVAGLEHEEEQPGASPESDEAERTEALRTRAASLSRELLAESAPHYPSDEVNILRLEVGQR